MTIETKLVELKCTLPPPPRPGGVYQSLLQVGTYAYFSGHLPRRTDGSLMTGRVGEEVDPKPDARLLDKRLYAFLLQPNTHSAR